MVPGSAAGAERSAIVREMGRASKRWLARCEPLGHSTQAAVMVYCKRGFNVLPELNDREARVIGCLIEKSVVTPDQYPLTLNALTSSDLVYIPLQTQFLAMQGLAKIKQVIDKVKFRLNKKLEIGGVIATMYDHRKVLNRDVVDTIRKYFGSKVFDTLIRDNVALAEAPAQRQNIFDYSRRSAGAKDYLSLCNEILVRTEAVPA